MKRLRAELDLTQEALAEEQEWGRIRIELLMLQALVVQAQGDLDRALSVLD